MNKKKTSKLLLGLLFAIPFVLVSSCDRTSSTETIEQITDVGGAGSFYVVNVSRRDTTKAGGGIYIGTSYPILTVKNGDEIKINFTPADKYSKYNFNVTYTLPDSTEVEGKGKDYNYSFVLNGFEPGNQYISMSAGSTEQVIISYGRVTLKITE